MSLLKNQFVGMFVLGAIFLWSLVIAVYRYQLNGFVVWWIASTAIVYIHQKFFVYADDNVKVNKTNNRAECNVGVREFFEVSLLIVCMPFIYILGSLFILGPIIAVADFIGVLDSGGGSFDPDAEYNYRR